MSSSEGPSGSSSPRLIRPVALSLKKQRSSSMNSVGSNQSNHQRSMSIISLELPRNSIISVDDNFLRPTRNNSAASLCSMGTAASPGEPKDLKPHRHKMRHKNNNSAIVSDEDSELELLLSHSKARWRRNSGEKAQRVSSLLSLKKDFKFRFDKKKPRPVTSNPLTPTSATVTTPAALGSSNPPCHIEDPVSSPLSLSHELPAFHGHLPPPHRQHHPHPQHLHLHSHQHLAQHQNTQDSPPPSHVLSTLWAQQTYQKPPSNSPGSLSPEENELSGQLRTPSKKSRSSLITQSMFLKKRMLLSKDLQLELLETGTSPSSPPIAPLDTRFPQPPLLHTQRPASAILEDSPVEVSTLRNCRSTSPPLQNFLQQEASVLQQNKLITELNKKWNKSVVDSADKRLDLVMATPTASSRKRDRSELVSSTDSHAIY